MNYNLIRKYSYILSSIIFFLLYLTNIQNFFSSIGIGLFVLFLIKFINDIGNKVEIRDIIILLSLFQWVIGPLLAYSYLPDNYIYKMSVSENVYMSYVIPSIILFIIGLFFPLKYNTYIDSKLFILKVREELDLYPNLDLVLIFIGIICIYFTSFLPRSLSFLIHLCSLLKYVGLFYLLYSKRKFKWLFVLVLIGSLYLDSVSEGRFHDLLLWGLFLVLIVAIEKKIKFRLKLLIMILGALGVILIQVSKKEVRSYVWGKNINSYDAALIMGEIMYKNLFNWRDISENSINNLITRINQGWIISAIIKNVPINEPFANGETIIRSLKDSLLPRVINPGKLRAGGHEYFERFTGRHINTATSMGLSIVGEAYANFGYRGKYFMFVIGLVFNVILFFIYRHAKVNPAVILWTPIIFLYSIKAETGLYTVLNYLIKALFFVVIVIFVKRNFYFFIFRPRNNSENTI